MLDNAAAFARLYGVVRYFYPSDASASLDWNRFAIHGVKQVRGARDTKALQATLLGLFSPLGPGIEISQNLPPPPALGSPDHQLIAWRYLGAGMSGSSVPGPYKAKRTRRPWRRVQASTASRPSCRRPCPDLRGKTIRLRGLVRATSREATAGAALWLRVDRPNQQMGFFDNMGNRPIREPDWKEYAIEGPVAEDATSVAFGVMASGDVTADFETIESRCAAADGNWTPMAIDDGGFEAAPERAGGWKRAGTSKNVEITRATDRAPEGRQFLRMSPMSVPRPVPRPPTSSLTAHRGPVPTSTSISGRASRHGCRWRCPRHRPSRTSRARVLLRRSAPQWPPSPTLGIRPTWTRGWPTWSSRGMCSVTSIRTGPNQASTGMHGCGRSSRSRTTRPRAPRIASPPPPGRRCPRRARERCRHPWQVKSELCCPFGSA